MDKIDYYGISTLIAAIAAAIVSVLAAIQSFRNSVQIKQVESTVNGLSDKRASEAFQSGKNFGKADVLAKIQGVPDEQRPATGL